jgi:hypothetical protein
VSDIPFLAAAASEERRASQARLGLCVATVQSSGFTFDSESFSSTSATGTTRQAQTVRQTFSRTAVGPTYAMSITDALAMGASIHVSRAAFSSLFQNTSTTYGGISPVTSMFYSASRGNSYDLSATIGATYRIDRYQTVAVSLELPSLHAFGSGGLNSYTHFDGATSGTTSLSADGDFAAYTPMRIALGTGIERASGSAELNVSAYVPVGPAYAAKLAGRRLETSSGAGSDVATSLDLSTRARGAVNVGVGGEIAVAPSISMLGGLSTDWSTVPKGALLSDPMSYFAARTNRVAASLGVGSHGEGGDLYVGGELAYAWGERLAVNAYQLPARLETTAHDTYSLLFVIAGTTSLNAIKRAVSDITDAVDPTKRLAPKKTPGAAPERTTE